MAPTHAGAGRKCAGATPGGTKLACLPAYLPVPVAPFAPSSKTSPAQAPPAELELLEQVAQAGSWHWRVTGADGLGPFSWTPALAQLLQWPPSSAPPWRSPWDLLAPKRRAAVQTLLQGAHQGNADPGEVIELESMALNAQGQEQPIRLLMRCQPDSGRAVWHGVVQDRSEHHQRLAQAQHERMQLSTTLASMTEAFATLDREGRLSYVNPPTCRLLERQPSQLLGQRLWRELDEVAGTRLHLKTRQALRSAEPAEFEAFVPSLDRWLEFRLYPFDEGLALYLRDVSERHRTQVVHKE